MADGGMPDARAPSVEGVRPAPRDGVRHRLTFEPGIEGVRALAVAAVVLFHSDLGLPGGYLGVSLFFTVSGFLISRLVADHLADGTFTLGGFWLRRARRLLPAAWLCVAVVVGLEFVRPWFWGRGGVRQDALASILHVANWWFLADARPYFDRLVPPSPLQHFWSLAIEEQFYLVVPLVAWLVQRRSRHRSTTEVATRSRPALAPGVATGVLVAGGLVAAWTAGAVIGGGDRSYYGTDVRSVELLAGVAAGLCVHRGWMRPGPRWGWLGVGGLGVHLSLWLWAPSQVGWLFPWGQPLVAASSVAVVMGAISPGPVARALSTRPFVEVGRRSYGIYLIHWPLLLATSERRWDTTEPTRWGVRTAALAVCSVAMFAMVETPMRQGRLLPRRVFVAVVTAGLTAAAVLAGIGAWRAAPAPAVDIALPEAFAHPFLRFGDILPTPVVRDGVEDLPTVVVRGDSAAAFLVGPLSQWAAEGRRFRVVDATAPGCAFVGMTAREQRVRSPLREGRPCPVLADEESVARALRPETVVFLAGPGDLAYFANGGSATTYRSGLAERIAAYRAVGSTIVVVTAGPAGQHAMQRDGLLTVVSPPVAGDAMRAFEATDGVAVTDDGGMFGSGRRDDERLRPDGLHVIDPERGRTLVDSYLGPALDMAHHRAVTELGQPDPWRGR